jgi:hypothetical protein
METEKEDLATIAALIIRPWLILPALDGLKLYRKRK